MMAHNPTATDGTAAPDDAAAPAIGASASSQAGPDAVRLIAMLNQKGGVGKTTSTVNLGAALAEAGQRVCLVDLDPQAHLTFHLGIDPGQMSRSVYDLLLDPECYASEAIINARPNLDVILAETDLAAAETELAQAPDRQLILRRKFQSLAAAYDVVILDCPPSLGLLTLNALSLAREVFVPMQAHFLALQGVGKLLETVGLVCQSINPQLRVSGIVLCMHEHQTTLAREIVADLDAFFAAARAEPVPWNNCRVLKPPIRRNVKLAEAPSFGKTIFDYDPACAGAADYRALADDLLKSWGRRAPGASTAQPKPAPRPRVVSISPPANVPSPPPASTSNPASAPITAVAPTSAVEVKPARAGGALPAKKAVSVSPGRIDAPAGQ